MRLPIVFVLSALLAGCGSTIGPDSTPMVTDIQVINLRYGQTASILFMGDNMNLGMTANVPKCLNQELISGSTPSVEGLTCTVKTTGPLTVEAKNVAGEVLFSKTFTVPLPEVTLTTTRGTIVAELDPVAAPATVDNLLSYVSAGFYTNTLFHRVISGFVIQGGWMVPGPSPQQGAKASIALESNNGLSNVRGTMAMARTTETNSASSQFYFNLVDNISLDYRDAANPGYAVFGKIVQGLDVMDAIGAVPTTTTLGLPNFPVTDVVVQAMKQTK